MGKQSNRVDKRRRAARYLKRLRTRKAAARQAAERQPQPRK